jgi:hypothetical protein
MKGRVFWVLTAFYSQRGIYYLHLQGRRVSQARNQQKQEAGWAPASGTFLLGLLFDPEDGGDMFVRNVGLSSKLSGVTFQKSILLDILHSFSEV